MDSRYQWMFGQIATNGIALDPDSSVMARYATQDDLEFAVGNAAMNVDAVLVGCRKNLRLACQICTRLFTLNML